MRGRKSGRRLWTGVACALGLVALGTIPAAASGGSTFVVGTEGGTFDLYAQDHPPAYPAPLEVERAGTMVPVSGTGTYAVRAHADRGRLRAAAATTLRNAPGNVSLLQWAAFAELHLRDLRVTGPAGATSVTATLNLRIDGDLTVSEHAEAEVSLSIGGSGYAGGGAWHRYHVGMNPLATGLFAGQSGNGVHRTLTTAPFTFSVGGGANFVDLRLRTYASCSSNTWQTVHATATTDFHGPGNGLTFGDGPVFNLPPGFSVDSADGLIVGNRWRDPTGAEILAPETLVAECRDQEGGAPVAVPFEVKAGGANLLRVRDVTADRTLLLVPNPTDGAYTSEATPFFHGDSEVLVELLLYAEVLASATVTVRVEDTELYTLLLPSEIVVETEPGRCGAHVALWASASDACDPAPALTFEAPWGPVEPGAEFPVGTTMVTCTVRDASGNETSGDFPVTVVDREPPAISGPAILDLVTDCDGSSVAISAATLGVTAQDGCDGEVPVTVHPTSVPVGSQTVRCEATDGDGNRATHEVVVRVLRRPLEAQVLAPLEGGVWNPIKAGRTVVLKLRLSCDGDLVQGATARVARVEQVDDAGNVLTTLVPQAAGASAGGGVDFREDPAEGTYLYNLSTRGWSEASGAGFRVVLDASESGRLPCTVVVLLRNR